MFTKIGKWLDNPRVFFFVSLMFSLFAGFEAGNGEWGQMIRSIIWAIIFYVFFLSQKDKMQREDKYAKQEKIIKTLLRLGIIYETSYGELETTDRFQESLDAWRNR